ncbi:MAG: ComF family protein [Alphaproteobacteria bacterium]|nr:ComF family protein [Alphaproteobacteria bacterium]MBE8220611.1 ComF family protein [Alphaproteobacteria bacterium]
MNYLVPPACPLCRAPLHFYKGQTTPSLCGGCWRDIDFITAPLCYRTGVPLPYETSGAYETSEAYETNKHDTAKHTISLPALLYPPPYHRARAALYYGGAAAQLVRAFKFYDHPEIAPLLAQWMHRAGQDFWQQTPDETSHEPPNKKVWLIPVPLHRRRFLWRRYNQAAELCRALSVYEDIPILFDALVRVQPTQRQVGLSRSQRLRNLGRAFQVRPSMVAALQGARVILIDDVITTGTTIEACTKILKRAGVAQVDVLAAARVVMPETYTRGK